MLCTALPYSINAFATETNFTGLLNKHTLSSERTFSFVQTSSFCPQTGSSNPIGMAYVVSIGSNYLKLGATKFVWHSRNMDGSSTYVPANGTAFVGFYQINAVLLSSDWKVMEERVTSSVGGFSMDIINTFQMYAEDGGEYAMAQCAAVVESQRGGSGSSSTSRSGQRANCSKCGGTGVDPTYQRYWGGRQSWLGHYNSSGSRCPYCGKYDQHYHSRCSDCNVPSY